VEDEVFSQGVHSTNQVIRNEWHLRAVRMHSHFVQGGLKRTSFSLLALFSVDAGS